MKKIILATFALAALFSCAKQPELPDPVTGARRVQIGANLPKETKVVFTEDGRNLKSTWKEGDKVSVIYKNGDIYVNEEFTLKSGAGTASGTFECATSSLPDGENFRICYPYYPAGDNTWTMLLGTQQGTLAGMGDLIPLSGTASSLSASPVLSPIVTFLRLKAGLKLLTGDDGSTNVPISFTVTGEALYATATYNGSTLTGNKAPLSLNGELTMSNGVLDQDVYVILHLTQAGLDNPSLDLRLHRGNDIYNWTITRTGDDKEMENGHMYTLSPNDANILSKLAPQKIKTAEPAPLKTLYVATDGNDSNAGTSIGAPLRTLQRAFDLAEAGTHIYLREGVYNEKAWLAKSGEKDRPIVVSRYADEEAIIDGTGLSYPYATDDALIALHGPGTWFTNYTGAHWITIRELTIRNSSGAGLAIICHSSHVTVEGCDIINCKGPGIGVGYLGYESEDICVRNNFVRNCAQTSREAISLRKVNGFQIYGNTLRSVKKESIDAKSGSRNGVIHHNNVFDAGDVGIYVDAGYDEEPGGPEGTLTAGQSVPTTRNILVYSNVIVYETRGGTGIAIASESGNNAHDIYVYNNIVYNISGSAPGSPTASACGIKVADNSDYGIVTGKLKDVYIYNNTVYNMPQQGIYVQFPNIENIVIRNNIAALNQAGDIQVNPKEDHLARKSSMEAQVTIQNNLFFNRTDATTHPGDPYENETEADKVFVDYGGDNWPNIDLHPHKDGKAINKGTFLTAPSTDFAGNARPRGGAVDIGAYEK